MIDFVFLIDFRNFGFKQNSWQFKHNLIWFSVELICRTLYKVLVYSCNLFSWIIFICKLMLMVFVIRFAWQQDWPQPSKVMSCNPQVGVQQHRLRDSHVAVHEMYASSENVNPNTTSRIKLAFGTSSHLQCKKYGSQHHASGNAIFWCLVYNNDPCHCLHFVSSEKQNFFLNKRKWYEGSMPHLLFVGSVTMTYGHNKHSGQ